MIRSNEILFESSSPVEDDVAQHQLQPFIPNSVLSRQVNFGQGEGQILVEDCIWGIYEHGNHGYRIQFEEGVLTPSDFIRHLELIQLSAESFFNVKFQVRIAGCWVD